LVIIACIDASYSKLKWVYEVNRISILEFLKKSPVRNRNGCKIEVMYISILIPKTNPE
jgi:hypothetical protein